MEIPLQITIRDTKNTDELNDFIKEKADKLSQFSETITSCHVTTELAKNHPNHGKIFDTHIQVSIPHKELISNHNENENLQASIRDAFEDIYQQLEKHMEKLHGHVKHHDKKLSGTIARIFTDRGFGFIEGVDGTEYYFTQDCVDHTPFKDLEVGNKVHFIEFTGKEGLQAHRVSRYNNDHL